MDILLSLVGGTVVVFGPFISFRFFNSAQAGFEKIFYLLIAICSLAIGFILFLSFWPTGIIALAISFSITYIFLIDRDNSIQIEPEIEKDLEKIIDQVKKD
jgi:hypothetical protein